MFKKILPLIIVTVLVLCSCKNRKNTGEPPVSNPPVEQPSESFKSIDSSAIDGLNKSIASGTLNTAEEIISAYAPRDSTAEGKYAYTITKTETENNTTEVTLIEEGLMDDSRAGRKVIMTLVLENDRYKIISMKENYKCWSGRGHETWGVEPCL
ncbi:MAG: hypothetical protein ACO25B_05180 [Chitinophagaceae bacterium]